MNAFPSPEAPEDYYEKSLENLLEAESKQPGDPLIKSERPVLVGPQKSKLLAQSIDAGHGTDCE